MLYNDSYMKDLPPRHEQHEPQTAERCDSAVVEYHSPLEQPQRTIAQTMGGIVTRFAMSILPSPNRAARNQQESSDREGLMEDITRVDKHIQLKKSRRRLTPVSGNVKSVWIAVDGRSWTPTSQPD